MEMKLEKIKITKFSNRAMFYQWNEGTVEIKIESRAELIGLFELK